MTISAIVPSISLFVYILVFGYAQGSEPLSGIFELSKPIYFNRYFQRVESVFIFMWVITSVVAVSILLYFAIASYCKIFNIKNHKPIILPFVFLMYMIALLPKSAIVLSEVHVLFLRQYSLILCYGIPIFTSLIAIIFRKKDKNAAPKKA